MAKIICIDTATPICSVALSINGSTITFREDKNGNKHAELLTIFIEEIMKESGLRFKDLDAIAVSKGPGSYTGLRVGVSTAKGLCYGIEKPLIAINTLKILASGYKQNVNAGELIIPMLDARRMEVYAGVYDSQLNEVSITEAKIIDENSFDELLNQTICHLIGSGAEKCKSIIKHTNARFVIDKQCSAKDMSNLVEEAFTLNKFEDTAYFEPFYLKDFVSTTPKKK